MRVPKNIFKISHHSIVRHPVRDTSTSDHGFVLLLLLLLQQQLLLQLPLLPSLPPCHQTMRGGLACLRVSGQAAQVWILPVLRLLLLRLLLLWLLAVKPASCAGSRACLCLLSIP